MPHTIRCIERQVVEWKYASRRKRDDPFNEMELDVVVRHSDGEIWRVPAYWAGEQEWRVRFCPPRSGSYEANAIWPDQADSTPREATRTLDVSPYEGFLHGNYDDVQRMAFWSCMLSGAAGHTYGANGIWQVNTQSQPYGPSPHGNTWGNRPWDEAMALPGSAQLGIGKRILLKYGWPDIEPHQEWIEPAASEKNRWGPYAAGTPRRVRIIYSYQIVWDRSLRVKGIESGITYRARFTNPSTGEEHDLGPVQPEADGSWRVPQQPELRDWVLVLEAT